VKCIKIIATVIMVLVLLASLMVFPVLGYMHSAHLTDLKSFIITCAFVFVWLIALLLAAIIKSKVLVYISLCYWLAIIGISTLALILLHIAVLEMFAFVLVVFLMSPLFGIYYLFSEPLNAVVLFIPLCMFLLSLFVKMKFAKELPSKQSLNERK